MRKLITIQLIEEKLPIEGADKIERVRILNWWCVASKGEFSVGDKCIYAEIDTLLPIKDVFSFMEKAGRKKTLIDGVEVEGYRLRTVRLRGSLSQGLVMPLSKFPGIGTVVGEDVTDFIGAVKYEAPVPACLSGEAEGQIPGLIVRTDEDRIQSCFNDMSIHFNKKFHVSEKIDGTSCTYFKYDNVFHACGHNYMWKDSEGNSFWRVARQYDLANKLPNGYAIQGELAGEGIQSNRLKLSGIDCYVFHVIDIDKRAYLSWDEMVKFVSDLGMKTVSLIEKDFIIGTKTCEDLLHMACRNSALNPRELLEGLVFRLQDTPDKISFKAISNAYLEKWGL